MSKLNEIAQQLQNQARRQPKAQRTLSRGLTLTLRFDARRRIWTLSLTRHLSTPSAKEEGICRAAFGVPESANRSQLTAAGGYNIVRFSWIDPPPQMPLIEAPEARHEYH